MGEKSLAQVWLWKLILAQSHFFLIYSLPWLPLNPLFSTCQITVQAERKGQWLIIIQLFCLQMRCADTAPVINSRTATNGPDSPGILDSGFKAMRNRGRETVNMLPVEGTALFKEVMDHSIKEPASSWCLLLSAHTSSGLLRPWQRLSIDHDIPSLWPQCNLQIFSNTVQMATVNV